MIGTAVEPGFGFYGPLGARAIPLRATLVRLLWWSIHGERGYLGMAQGWFAADISDKRDVLIREFDPDAEILLIPRVQGGL